MPDDTELNYILKKQLLTNDELLTLIQDVFIPVGFNRFRLTGGEPLLRPGVVDLVNKIAHLPQTQDLSMTTNGFLLAPLAQDLYNAGLTRINISLDSLNPDTFNLIIGDHSPHGWEQVWHGIQSADKFGFNPLKLNVVVIPGINDHEILNLAALTLDKNWHVRFIEFMPIGNNTLFSDRGWVSSAQLRDQIRQRWGLTESQVRGNGPADVFQIPGAKGTLGFISQMSECFCDRCNRLRLSADGWLRPCLLNESGQIDLKTALRSGQTVGELQQQVRELLNLKSEINFKERNSGTIGTYSRTMSQIGG
jgi:cyclic pyranopterin phosphate synthase